MTTPRATSWVPEDPLPRFLDLYLLARDGGSWFERQSATLRHASLSLVPIQGRPSQLVQGMRRTAEELKRQTGVFSPLRGPLRYLIAAQLNAFDVGAERFAKEYERTRNYLQQEKLPRSSGAHVALATLALVENAREQYGLPRVHRDQVVALGKVFRALKEDHPWLTGSDDLVAAALLSERPEAPARVALRAEAIYQGLRSLKFSRGNALQMVSHLLCLHPEDPDEVVRRFHAVYYAFKDRGLWMFETDYDEVAALCFTDQTANTIADLALDQRDALRSGGLRLGANESFSLACSLAMLQILAEYDQRDAWTQFAMLVRVQSIVHTQQAAAASVAAGAGAGAAT